MNSNVINKSCLTSSNAVNQTFLRRSSTEKRFSRAKVLTSQREIWGSASLPPEKFSKITCSRTSENAFLLSRKTIP